MSYCNWMESRLYVYASVDGWVCQECPLIPQPKMFGVCEEFLCKTRSEMVTHLQRHREAGHDSGQAIPLLEMEIRQYGETKLPPWPKEANT